MRLATDAEEKEESDGNSGKDVMKKDWVNLLEKINLDYDDDPCLERAAYIESFAE